MGAAIDLIAVAMRDGGPVMWPIALCSLLVELVTLRKALQWIYYRFTVRSGTAGWDATLETLRAEGAEAAEKRATKEVSPYAAVLVAAMRRKEEPFGEALEVEARALTRRLARGLGVLDTIVTLAPMLGILGTVTGIIGSFSALGTMGTDNPTAVAGGIAEALYTTAAGLIVSICALIPLNVGRVCHKALVRDLETAMTDVERAAGIAQ